MDATELLYEARQLAARVPPHRRDAARAQVERAEAELDALEARLRKLIGQLEKWIHNHGGER